MAEAAGPPSPLAAPATVFSPEPANPSIALVVASILRTRRLPSTTYRLCATSIANPIGWFTFALSAGPLSPLVSKSPLPAMVVMIPVAGSTRRTRLFSVSAMRIVPSVSTATDRGWLSAASAAGAPSPANPRLPLPATVVTLPAPSTLRTWLAAESRMTVPPVRGSKATASGVTRTASVATIPSANGLVV